VKITRVEAFAVLVPRRMPPDLPEGFQKSLAAPLATVVAKICTDAGIDGVGHTLTLNGEFLGSLTRMVRELGALLVGQDPHRPEHLQSLMLYPANWIGPGGMLHIAAAALDIAVWDIVGKSCGQPLWRLLGGYSDRARVYDSGSLLANDLDALQKAASASVGQGYRAMKMRPGPDRHGRVSEVVRRVNAVREAVGFDVDLMYDVNQTWSVPRAIRAARALEEFELFWIEDPTAMHDIAGQAAIAEAVETPICSGEYHYDSPSLLRLLQARAVDYLMVDLLRMGGITHFRKVAALANAFGVPIASHLVPEIFAHCIAAIPNGLMVEGMPWTEPLFQDLPRLQDGQIVLSERAGHGLRLDESFVRAHRVDA
jgi:L-alanine-DL-glutamate epimerase-like enolase superfamily enzyme